jgi:hypothetical protein
VPDTTAVSGIRLNTFPEDATISINGQQAGRGPIQKDLPPNQYTVRAELPGFQPSETRVNVIAGYRQEITINLQASAGNSNMKKRSLMATACLWSSRIQQALGEDPIRSRPQSLACFAEERRLPQAVDRCRCGAKLPNSALILACRSRPAMGWAKILCTSTARPPISIPINEGSVISGKRKARRERRSRIKTAL